MISRHLPLLATLEQTRNTRANHDQSSNRGGGFKWKATNIQILQNQTQNHELLLGTQNYSGTTSKLANRDPTENSPKFLKTETKLEIKSKINPKIINEITPRIQPDDYKIQVRIENNLKHNKTLTR